MSRLVVPGPSDVNGVIEAADDLGHEDDGVDCVEETLAEEFTAGVHESPTSPCGFGRMVDYSPNAKVGVDVASVDCTVSLGDDDQTFLTDLLSVSDVLMDMFPTHSIKRNLSAAFKHVVVLEASMPSKSAISEAE
ncbi:hypothetical protein MtrunA17_Chr6g0471391 [Medicago truncatula]|uniref:Uncharacterized protein n=1 Tax=Medicago truncatula TaxID=3880 RepID=A0A396HEJ5_MEDTR|nr:hypothetical protein MtrunA17_Chr6g0471391 [Medicago truncatula]